MSVKIEKGAKIGDNNAIGDNASVKVTNSNERTKETRTWFGEHPWLFAL